MVYLIVMSVVNGRMSVAVWWIGKELEGSGCDLIKAQNTQLAGGTEEKHNKVSHIQGSHRYRQDNVDFIPARKNVCLLHHIWSSSGIQPAFCLRKWEVFSPNKVAREQR